jgi:hypothetical protein
MSKTPIHFLAEATLSLKLFPWEANELHQAMRHFDKCFRISSCAMEDCDLLDKEPVYKDLEGEEHQRSGFTYSIRIDVHDLYLLHQAVAAFNILCRLRQVPPPEFLYFQGTP